MELSLSDHDSSKKDKMYFNMYTILSQAATVKVTFPT